MDWKNNTVKAKKKHQSTRGFYPEVSKMSENDNPVIQFRGILSETEVSK